MKSNEIKHLNFLGHKRNINTQMPNDETKTNEEEKTKEDNHKIFYCKKHEYFTTIKERKNRINLGSKNEYGIDNNINIRTENGMNKKICQRCNSLNNVLSFNNFGDILDYSFKKNILIFQNFHINEKLNFDSPKNICSSCLLFISKNNIEFERFFASNNIKKNNVNNNNFQNPLENLNLKNFNDIDIKEKSIKNQNVLNDKSRDFFEKLNPQNIKKPPASNNTSNNKNNSFNNQNMNFDFFNIFNNLPLPLVNYNIPLNQNITNLNISTNNNNDKNPEIKNSKINQINPLQNQNLNYPDILKNTLLEKPEGILAQNSTDILNFNKLPLFNKNYPLEKNNKKENSPDTIRNNINNNKNGKENISKNDDEKIEQNDLYENFTIIQNKDFEEIWQKTNLLFQKLLNIKIGQDLSAQTKQILEKNSQTLSSNNSSFINSNLNDNNNTNSK